MLSYRVKMKLINWWPPLLGTGISLTHISKDYRTFKVQLKRRWYNRNLVDTHYGGSLYSMCDPWYMFILIANLGKDYIVWDKAATIRFKRPGKGTVEGIFTISEERIAEIKNEIDTIGKKDYTFEMNLTGEDGEIICELEKLVYVRKKDFVK